LKLEVGQRIDIEVDLEDLFDQVDNKIIATWFHKGNPIYIELEVSAALVKQILKYFENTKKRSALLSVTRVSQRKFEVQPAMVVVSKRD
jgi:hypothetical protein